MIVRRHLISVLTIVLILWANPESIKGERWSRQILNSEWIPLANPRSLHDLGGSQRILSSEEGSSSQVQQFALPPELREQYQQQLYQLQETQESIKKLLLLQQQLRAQQQLLQAQSYLPEGFSTDEERKAALHQSTIANLQTLPQLAPNVLLPPIPLDEHQPPEFLAQDFLSENVEKIRDNNNNNNNENRGYGKNGGESSKNEQNYSGREEKTKDHTTRQGGHYKNSKQFKDNQNTERFVSQSTPSSLNVENEEEEVQLLYVPAETLAQRNQNQKIQRGRNRKQQQQIVNRQQNRYQQQEEVESQGIDGARPSAAQQAFAQQVLYQIQQEQAERNRAHQEEREKEIARLEEEEKELERQAKLHQELVIKEQELKRQKELEVRREIERQEEDSRQKELQRIRESKQRKILEEEAARKKEAERQKELERQKIAEIFERDRQKQEVESRQAEIDRLAALEREKEIEIQRAIEQQRELERQQAEDEANARAQIEAQRQAQAAAQLEAHRKAHQDAIEKQKEAQIEAGKIEAENRARNKAQQQHLTETVKPKNSRIKGRQRQRNRGGENQTVTPSPNQPPLSVYMGSVRPEDLKISDVLNILKDAKTISVLDSVGPDTPQVFVGPTNLDPPSGYAKFDLPYLSSIDNNRVERKVDKLPFFVAPLSFKPPPGYSKIPFPAPHIGSVVVNTLDDNLSGIPNTEEGQVSNISPNSYVKDSLLPVRDSYNPETASVYPQNAFVPLTSTPNYEQSYSSTPISVTRYRHRQFYNERSPHGEISSTESSVTKKSKNFRKEEEEEEEQNHRETLSFNSETTPLPLQDQLQSNFPTYNEELSFINGELSSQGKISNHNKNLRNNFNEANQQKNISPALYDPQGNLHSKFNTAQGIQDPEGSRGPIQYNVPSEFPRISPQLPGLVNSLIESNESTEKISPPFTTTTTTTTTTSEPSTTTHRTRGRQRGRIVPTRAPTTTEYSPTRSSIVERSRRPTSRSRIRQGHVSTTEINHETIYDTVKSSKISNNHEKEHQRRLPARNQRYRGRVSDKNVVQPEVSHTDSGSSHLETNSQSQLERNLGISSLREPSASIQNSNIPVQNEQNTFEHSSSVTTNQNDDVGNFKPNAQPLQSVLPETTVADTQRLQQSIHEIEGINYQSGFESSNYGQTNVEQNPVNGFNYRSQNENIHQGDQQETQKSSEQYKHEENFGVEDHQIVTEKIKNLHDNNQPGDLTFGKEGVNNFQNIDLNQDKNYNSNGVFKNQQLSSNFDNTKSPIGSNQRQEIFNENIKRPIYDHFSTTDKDFTTTSATTTEIPETTTVTPAPITVRQRVRTRFGQNFNRPKVDSIIQTRPSGSRDEFVRFSAVNQDRQNSVRTQAGARLRPRNRVHLSQPHVQTESNDYVRIQTPAQKSTTTTTQIPQNEEEEIEYGFIRPPSFKPIHPVGEKHAANILPTYKPKYEQVKTTDELSTNDEQVEISTPEPQTLKNRQRYHVMNRRPLTRSTTASPYHQITTTQSIEKLNDDVYTARQKSRNEELKNGRIRSRVRRPGQKRITTTTTTTTTTESVLESSNELPADENYPEIIQGTIHHHPSDATRRTIFNEELKSTNLDKIPQAEALQGNAKLHSLNQQENLEFPRSDFVLNFGVGSEHEQANEEYDQTQLGNNPKIKYSNVNGEKFEHHSSYASVADIEGAESQWSTKLTVSSFQPSSLPNHVRGEAKNRERQEKSEDTLDIITAGPDLSSHDILVTDNDSDIVLNASYLGNTKRDERRKKDSKVIPVLQSRFIVEDVKNETFKNDEGSLDLLQFWNNDKNEATLNVNEAKNDTVYSDFVTTKPNISRDFFNITTTIDPKKTFVKESSETSDEPKTTKKTFHRRRRVRIRVRPSEDIVSAESQRVNYPWNTLIREKELKITTTESPFIFTPEPTTGKSFIEEFLDEMTKNSNTETTTNTDSTSTNVSDVFEQTTTSTETTTPAILKNVFTVADSYDTTIDLGTTLANDEETSTVNNNLHKNHRFHPKKSYKTRLSNNQETIHKDNDEIFTTELTTNQPTETTTNFITTSKNTEDKISTTERNFSDYVNDFFKSFQGEKDDNEKKNEQVEAAVTQSSPLPFATEKTEEGNEEKTTTESGAIFGDQKSFVTDAPISVTVYDDVKAGETEKIISSTTEGKEIVSTSTTAEIVPTNFEQEIGSNFDHHTTPEVPLSPAELTTEIPTTTAATKTIKLTSIKINPSIDHISKVLRTSTETKVSHMTEICYRGKCVKTQSRKEVRRR